MHNAYGRDHLFDYSEESSHRWGEILGEIRRERAELLTRVLWGVHEQTPGVIDFSKSSLRLEKLLKAASVHGLQIDLWTGFPPANNAFPTWTRALSKQTMVPLSYWEDSLEGFTLAMVPSLDEESFRASFLTFLNELLNLVNLYWTPGGSMRKIFLDLSIYGMDLSAMDRQSYLSVLERRYPTVKDLNNRYTTSFNRFSSAASRQGFRTLADKRPWLTAFDYQWARQELLSEFREEIKSLPAAQGLGDRLAFSKPPVVPCFHGGAWQVQMDPVMLEVMDSRFYPFTPAGTVIDSFVTTHRLAEYLSVYAKEVSVPLRLLSSDDISDNEPCYQCWVVICGKYLRRQDSVLLKKHLAEGGTLLFPLSLPQYDENMLCYDWKSKKPTLIRQGRFTFSVWENENGRIYLPSPILSYGDSLWPDLLEITSLIKELTRNK